MAAPSVTYTFTNGTTADGTQVNTNFTDLINGASDGTKDYNVGTLTVTGAVAMKGTVSLGDGTPDDISFLGSLATSIPIKTNNSYNIGTSTLGLASVYLGGSTGSLTTRLVSGATGSSWTFTFPTTTGSANQVLQTNGSGVTSWVTPSREIDAKQDYSFTTSVAASAMTVALKYSDGNDATSTNVIRIAFRNSTSATGTNNVRTVTAALSMDISSGATLGHANGLSENIYVYALDNAGTVELAVSGTRMFDEGSVYTTGAMSGSATSKTTLYSTTSRSNVPIRYLGRIKSTQTTAGTWAATHTESSTTVPNNTVNRSEVLVTTPNGWGSTDTFVRLFSTLTSTGSAITGVNSATLGTYFTINEDGVYAISYFNDYITANIFLYITKNETALTSDPYSNSSVIGLAYATVGNTAGFHADAILNLVVGDIIRPMNAATGSAGASTAAGTKFRITKIAD